MKVMINDYSGLEIYPGGYTAAPGFMQTIDAIRAAGGQIDGISLEDYASDMTDHTAAGFMAGIQTFNVQGLPVQESEFGTFAAVSPADSARILGEEMRLIFGNPDATGFTNWYFVKEDDGSKQDAPNGALYTISNGDWSNMTLTQAGKIWQDQLGIQDWDGNPNNGWNTQLTATVDANGAISFNGYYGDYLLFADGKTYTFTLVKGTTNYTVTELTSNLFPRAIPVPEPAKIWLALIGGYVIWAAM
jgi:hypothetical protein